MAQRKTRIVATLGPASSSPEAVRKLIRAGVDVVRLNFSHGTHEFHRDLVRTVRKVSAELDVPVAIMQDLAGPKMRVGRVHDDVVRLRNGAMVEVVEGSAVGSEERLTLTAAGIIATLKTGQPIKLADGLLELRVVARIPGGVMCRVVHGGLLRSRQGVNIPGVHRGLASLTPKDRKDLAFGLSLGVDAVAISFVREAGDVMDLRRLLQRHGARAFVIAKIERGEALANLEKILEVASGVMVARGDLGVEIGVENVPLAQKRIIREALRAHRPVITATQMLESMIERPSPTRAEVSDIANAVLEGTDALMLSGETAVGAYPEEAVSTLARVARQVEQSDSTQSAVDLPVVREDPAMAVARAARIAARAVQASAIAVFTDSGRTARLVSSQRPQREVFGFSYRESTIRRLKFFWGVTPMLVARARSNETMVADAKERLLRRHYVRRGDRIVIVCGEIVHSGATNTIKIHTIGEDGRPQRRKHEQAERAERTGRRRRRT